MNRRLPIAFFLVGALVWVPVGAALYQVAVEKQAAKQIKQIIGKVMK